MVEKDSADFISSTSAAHDISSSESEEGFMIKDPFLPESDTDYVTKKINKSGIIEKNKTHLEQEASIRISDLTADSGFVSYSLQDIVVQ